MASKTVIRPIKQNCTVQYVINEKGNTGVLKKLQNHKKKSLKMEKLLCILIKIENHNQNHQNHNQTNSLVLHGGYDDFESVSGG